MTINLSTELGGLRFFSKSGKLVYQLLSTAVKNGNVCEKLSNLISHYFVNDGEIWSIAYFDSSGNDLANDAKIDKHDTDNTKRLRALYIP